MKKLIPCNSRPVGHFVEGIRAFYFENTKEDPVACYEKYGKSHAPGSLTKVTVTGDTGGGGFILAADRNFKWGSKNCFTGGASPFFLREDEIEWLMQELRRLGTADYAAIQRLAQNGDDAALVIVGYCESAHWFIVYQRVTARSEELTPPYFDPQQFLETVEEFARQPA